MKLTRGRMVKQQQVVLLLVAVATFLPPIKPIECNKDHNKLESNQTTNLHSDRQNPNPNQPKKLDHDEIKNNNNNETLVETLSEQLVRQSNLEALESQQDASLSILPPPPELRHNHQQQQQPSTSGSSHHGSSTENSYMSIARDGSDRYEFGFDTAKGGQQSKAKTSTGGDGPRLMREESRLEDGTVIGRYGYTDPFNVFRIVQYVAGPDGYFATEDVGAVEDNTGGSGAGGRLQLNKQLHRALEVARAQRLAKQQQQERAAGADDAARLKRSQKVRLEREEEQEVESRRLRRQQQQSEETLAGSGSHQSVVRFSTKINHVIGVNGVSYATAFRPVIRRQTDDYEPVRRAQPYASGSQLQFTAVAADDYSSEQLRSKLPAPIYSPNTFGFTVDHSATSGSSQQPLQKSSSTTLYGVAHLPVERLSSDGPSVQVGPQTNTQALRSSPAWDLLNYNYNQQLVIDHKAPAAGQQGAQEAPAAATATASNGPHKHSIGGLFGHDFQRQANLLRSMQRQTSGYGSSTPYDHTRAYRVQPNFPAVDSLNTPEASHLPFGARMSLTGNQWPEAPSTPVDHQLNYNQQPQQQAPPAVGYNLGMALKQFNPPLYHPEVHETTHNAAPPPTAVYASTIIHSEVAAERDYRPERVPSSNGGPATDAHSSRLLLQQDRNNGATSSEPLYATRLRSIDAVMPLAGQAASGSLSRPLNREADEWEDMEFANSEQVAYLASLTNNSTSGAPRARIPDRSRKLTSIFKARSSASGSSDEAASSSSLIKIRRPVPSNIDNNKKLQEEQRSNNNGTSEAKLAGSQHHHADAGSITTSDELQTIALKPTIIGGGAKKFGKVMTGSGRPDGVTESLPAAVEHEPAQVTSAKRRPILRGSGEPKMVETISSKQIMNLTQVQQQFDNSSKADTTYLGAILTPPVGLVAAEPLGLVSTERSSAAIAANTTARPIGDPNLPIATIIDASDQSNESMRSKLDKDLYEKIIKIQREIAAMAMASTSTTTSRPGGIPASPAKVIASAASTVPPVASKSITDHPSSKGIDQIDIANSTTRPRPREDLTIQDGINIKANSPASTSTTTKAPITITTTTGRQTSFVPPQRSSSERLVEPTIRLNVEPQDGGTALLTGPLVSMDSSVDQSDFMAKLASDMDAFDSVRAQTIEQPTSSMGSFESVASVAPASTGQSSLDIDKTVLGNGEATSFISTTERAIRSNDEPNGARTKVLSLEPKVQQNSQQPLEQVGNKLEALSTAHIAPQNAVGAANEFRNSSQQSTSKPETISTTTSKPSTTAGPRVETTTITSTKSTTTAPISPVTISAQAQNVTSTTTLAPTTSTSTSTTPRPTKKSSVPARFGRLVIKRGDKVVARFNASEPIPDSMIPIGGSNGTIETSIIVPDLPRLGMRKTVKRKTFTGGRSPIARKQGEPIENSASSSAPTTTSTAASTIIPSSTSTTTSTTSTTTTTTPRPTSGSSNSSLGMITTQTPSLNTTELPEADNKAPTLSSTSSSTITATLTPPVRAFRRSLTREPRSYARQNDPTLVDLMESESKMEAELASGIVDAEVGGHFRSSSPSNQIRSPKAPLEKLQASAAANGYEWSSRLRDVVAQRPPVANVSLKYDPKDELRKLVQKIGRLEEASTAGSMRFPVSETRIGSGKNNNDKFVIDKMIRQQKSGRRTDVDEANQLATTPQTPNLNLKSASSSATNISSLGSLVSLVKFDFNGTGAAAVPAEVGQINSKLIQVISNSSDREMTMMKMPQRSESKSATFTVNFTPEMAKRWEQLKPVEPGSLKRNLSTGINPASEIRVDSRGFIHVRHNQSVTVHVDIEPPRRILFNVAEQQQNDITSGESKATNNNISSQLQQQQQQPKRLMSRDTLATGSPGIAFGGRDIQRLNPGAKLNNRIAPNANDNRSSLLAASEPAISGDQIGPANNINSESTTRQNKSPAADAMILNELNGRYKRRPRMLCIEVEPDLNSDGQTRPMNDARSKQ